METGDTLRFQFEMNGGISERTFRVIGIAYFPSIGLFYSSPEVIGSISPFNNTSHLSVVCDENSRDECQRESCRDCNGGRGTDWKAALLRGLRGYVFQVYYLYHQDLANLPVYSDPNRAAGSGELCDM